ncbi:MAG: hypothetical protein HYW01_04470 [Deltaproteobacteria bacterium]|nr:hypothetical protein [Deltaproteobacteria bacterium]
MIKHGKSLLVLGMAVFLLSFSIAHAETNINKEVTIKGQVIDPVCLITMDMKGEGHRECAANCAKAGMNLAIMDEKGKIYPILPEKAVTNPNQPVLDYVEKTVTVKGTLFESGGVSYIVVKEIKGS